MKLVKTLLAGVIGASLMAGQVGQVVAGTKVDPNTPEYTRASAVSGNISSVVSDT